MKLKEMVERNFSEVFDEYGFRFVGNQSDRRAGKMGEGCETVEFSSSAFRLRIERSDGEVNALLLHVTWDRWRYVRELSDPNLRDAPVEEVLARVPDHWLSDEEMLAGLVPPVTVALKYSESIQT